jgi:hypothetical protein
MFTILKNLNAGLLGPEQGLTPEQALTREAELLYYRSVEWANHAWYEYRALTGAQRANHPDSRKRWARVSVVRERAYLRMLRRRRLTGITYVEG